MTNATVPPPANVLELTLIGPGYGETVVLHLGDGRWAIVDSCEDEDGHPRALQYLDAMDVDPARSVVLIIATHWHDDHIRGMGRLVKICETARFCCASVLTSKEFVQTVRGFDERLGRVGSGLREYHDVLLTLRHRRASPVHAVPNRVVHSEGACDIRCLSPSDSTYRDFLHSIADSRAPIGRSKNRVPVLRPNQVSVAMWVKMGDTAAVLGADLERSGWKDVLELVPRPSGLASVFKVPHHGAPNAHEPKVWAEMLEEDVHAVLTPWRAGRGIRPTHEDARRILACSENAYITADATGGTGRRKRREQLVERTLADARAHVGRTITPVGTVRLRKEIDSNKDWSVELFGGARHLHDYLGGNSGTRFAE